MTLSVEIRDEYLQSETEREREREREREKIERMAERKGERDKPSTLGTYLSRG